MSTPNTCPRSSRLEPLRQCWADYRPEQHQVWATLYRRRMERLPAQASQVFLQGIHQIGLVPDQVPNLADVNRRLTPRTGWRAVPVAGFIEAAEFLGLLANRRFPTTITIRGPNQLDYTPEPDIFHDVFGHVPLHADPDFADLLQRFGILARRARSQWAVERMARLFWFTVEFGLIAERGEVRVYGSGLISSSAEADHALGDQCQREPFDLETVLETGFAIDVVQPRLFVIESFRQLFEALERAAVLTCQS